MTFSRISFVGAVFAAIACGPSTTPPPGVSSEAFDGPGDKLTKPERDAFRDAANAIHDPVVRCIEWGYESGVRAAEVKARVRFRKDGHITAVGFKSEDPDEGARKFLDCMRAAIAKMDLSKGPWESDHSVVYPFSTSVVTSWE